MAARDRRARALVAGAMRRGMMLTNSRANPLDEFNATIPGLDNMLPTLPKAIPGAGLMTICLIVGYWSRESVVWGFLRTPGAVATDGAQYRTLVG